MKQMAKLQRLSVNEELEYVRKVVDEHPVFKDVPWRVKKELLVKPAENWKALGLNRSRRRRLERNGGAVIHLFAGPRDGHDLSRAFRELGGDPRDILEYDIVRSENHDLLSGELMGGLMRLAMDGKIKALLGGPNCRTRSVLRFYPLEHKEKPRPVRTVEERWGMKNLDKEEERIVFEDDVLLFRFILLYVLADLKSKSEDQEEKGRVGFLIEQPAEPKNEPRCPSFWRTEEWQRLKQTHGLCEVTFKQGDWGGRASKPTTVGTTMALRLCQERPGGEARGVDGGKPRWEMSDEEKLRTSKELSRWAPGMMRGYLDV